MGRRGRKTGDRGVGRYGSDLIYMTGAVASCGPLFGWLSASPCAWRPGSRLPSRRRWRAAPGPVMDIRGTPGRGAIPPAIRAGRLGSGCSGAPLPLARLACSPSMCWGSSRPARGARRCPCRPADGDARPKRKAAATRGRAQMGRLRPAPWATIRPPYHVRACSRQGLRERGGAAPLTACPPSVVTDDHGGAPDYGPGVPLAHLSRAKQDV